MAYPKTSLREFTRQIAPRVGPRHVNPANYVSKLRRIRTELGLLMQQLDDTLANIDRPEDS